jgi:hypothetical protein
MGVDLRLVVNRAVGRENKEVIQDGHAFRCLVLSRLEMFADDPLKTVGREICRQQASHRWQNLASNLALALVVCVGPKIDCLCGHVS